MFPEKTIFEAFGPSAAPMLEQTFLAAWAIVCPKNIEAGSAREIDLRMELACCIAKLASKGCAGHTIAGLQMAMLSGQANSAVLVGLGDQIYHVS